VRHHLVKDKSLRFVDFMTGEDTVWVCENDKSKSIINVLAFVNSNNEINENLPNDLLRSIRARVFTKLVLTKQFPKLFYRRMRDLSGYFYWTSDNRLSINDYVRYLGRVNEEDVISEEQMKRKMSLISNDALPAENSALWECLIGPQPIRNEDGIKYPVSNVHFGFENSKITVENNFRSSFEFITLLAMVWHYCVYSLKP
jgi:hypothetical protein